MGAGRGQEAEPRLRRARLQGLCFNAALPDHLRIRLLDLDPAPEVLARRDVPPAVVDAAVDHPDRRVRGPARRMARVPSALRRPVVAAVLGEAGGARRRLLLQAAGETRRGLTQEAYGRLAADPTARRLPPDVVERLARDGDRVVRLFLAENCDDAPAEMLVEVWQWWDGSYSSPHRPCGYPNFPRRDLLHHTDDPPPRLRQLALGDPDSTPGLVERFSTDEDAEVRLRAATDPRLSAASAVRMLDDPDSAVRAMAARHARLPVPVLVALLGDGATAEAAARNPALPVAVMERMTATGP